MWDHELEDPTGPETSRVFLCLDQVWSLSVVATTIRKMLVYVTPTQTTRKRFHKTPDCLKVRSTTTPVELAELGRPRPCRTCYPDAPAPRSAHRVCHICNTMGRTRPCPHNGGVPIHRSRPNRFHLISGEDTVDYVQYVWPEHVHLYV